MKTTRSFWPFGIIVAFAVFIAGTVGLIVFASTQNSELVSADYYEQELKFQNRIDGVGRANELGGRASANYDAASEQFTVSVPPEQLAAKFSGRIQLYRPSSAGLDREIALLPDANGMQQVSTKGLRRGLWKARVSWTAAGQEYFLEREFVIGGALLSTPRP